MKNYLKQFCGHLKTVLVHKWWVLYYANGLGITWQGLIHDLSKFSPTEFSESVRYWTGKRSPIVVAKEKTGISYAWLHHKGRNRHHYEYWIDKLDQGGVPHKIPFKYVLEMICDGCAACRTYSGDGKDIFIREYEWWKERIDRVNIHEQTKKLIISILLSLSILSEHCAGTPSTTRNAMRFFKRSPFLLKRMKDNYSVS